jgi:mono/diheme cytochrome c family protein
VNKKRSPLPRIIGIVVLLLICFAVLQFVRHWRERKAARKLKNPVPVSVVSLADGKMLYGEHCQKCHGEKGDGKGEKAPELREEPTNFTDAKHMSRQADGEIFMPIEKGTGPMPAFADKMTEQQAWEIVDYVRTFAPAQTSRR